MTFGSKESCSVHCSIDDVLVDAAMLHIDACLCLPSHFRYSQTEARAGWASPTPGLVNGAILVTGPRGVGKTSVGGAICREASGGPRHAYVRVVECRMWHGA